MSRRWTWLILALLVIVVGILAAGETAGRDSPEHSSTSDGPHGTSALRQFAGALGHPTSALEGTFNPSGQGLIFVFTPTTAYSGGQGTALSAWVSRGGVLVYASESGDPQLDRVFGVHRASLEIVFGAEEGVPVLVPGAGRLQGGSVASPLLPTNHQVALVRDSSGAVAAVKESLGSGQVFVLADPCLLCNVSLLNRANGHLAADLLGAAAAGSPVAFDEFHHGYGEVTSGLGPWATTAWGAALMWAVLVVVGGLALRGRQFGPPVPLRPPSQPSSREFAAAVGALLERVKARGPTLERLLGATRRSLAGRLRLPPGPDLDRMLASRSPAEAARLREIEARLPAAAGSETGAVAAARELHALAYPTTEGEGT